MPENYDKNKKCPTCGIDPEENKRQVLEHLDKLEKGFYDKIGGVAKMFGFNMKDVMEQADAMKDKPEVKEFKMGRLQKAMAKKMARKMAGV